ncbi:sensor histidine kinase [Noviherbaspirillum denitrificans]|uniref:C4-dicarboxylate transport sensor protein DctB n=1 Tax=Noviherbaspirillum denitrificans TaxID=1968433 RepID=A0A254TJ43_9BURK|nr:ATP-binding protein [Noviherbaspirillum denitrificans]OWW22515.1 C4-dicarboxylate ABC transporter [Noviherbaspirillum denitrificans]
MFSKRPALLVLAAISVLAVVIAAWLVAAHRARADIHAAGDRQLQIIALDLESVLEKFETLPFTLANHPDVPNAIERPDDGALIQRLNETLQTIQRHAKVSAIYIMDRHGNTLASSNWDMPLSFVGKNFAYRPYFRDAMEGRAGRFYGIGSTTSEPGYFIAQPVHVPGATEPVGVIAVKISLSEFEETWRRSEDPIALADSSGVVFLSSRTTWRYHSMRPLADKAREYLGGTLQYAGLNIEPISSLPKAEQAGFGEYVARPVGRLDWQLMLFPSQARVQRSAALAALTAALLVTVAGISWWALHQRRRRMEERLASRQALQRAAEELDRNIAQRTRELLDANQRLESKYAKLKEAEQLLRTTQNELVQAGKLAMLGQMAAGVTHELNQPLAAIRAFADNAVTFLARGQGDRAGENLAQISAASARMGAIIGQLKGFARKSHETVAVVDLAQAVQASALLLEGDYRRQGVEFSVDIREAVQIVGDTVRTEQVLINLLRNALDAVEGAPVRKVDVVLEREGNEAVVRIVDSGPGITDQVAPHLFEPFFTTKASGKGLGLGLAISSSIVQAMNGQLTARNHAGGGAEFVVRLPAAAEISNVEGGKLASA